MFANRQHRTPSVDCSSDEKMHVQGGQNQPLYPHKPSSVALVNGWRSVSFRVHSLNQIKNFSSPQTPRFILKKWNECR